MGSAGFSPAADRLLNDLIASSRRRLDAEPLSGIEFSCAALGLLGWVLRWMADATHASVVEREELRQWAIDALRLLPMQAEEDEDDGA